MLPATEGNRISIPSRMRARYAAITTPGHRAIAKLLTFPGTIDASYRTGALPLVPKRLPFPSMPTIPRPC